MYSGFREKGMESPPLALIKGDIICICIYFILVLAFWENRIHEQLLSFERAETCGVFWGHVFTRGGGKKSDLCIAAWASGCRWQIVQHEILQRLIKILKQCIFLSLPCSVWLRRERLKSSHLLCHLAVPIIHNGILCKVYGYRTGRGLGLQPP